MSFGGAQVKEIEYTFIQDSLFAAATITAKGKRDCGRLKDALTAEYGAPSLDEDEKAVWKLDTITVYYKYDPVHGQREDTAEAHILSNEIYGMPENMDE